MFSQLRGFRLSVRVIALMVSATFLYAEAVQAQGLTRFSYPAKTLPLPQDVPYMDPLDGFELPPEIGKLQEVYVSSAVDEESPQFVIHIRDSHANYQAQQNISQILTRLFSDDFNGYAGKTLICLEGASGPVDPEPFRKLSDTRAKKVVADSYLQQGKITAAEFFAMTHERPVPIFGIETPGLYEKNIQYHLKVKEAQKEAAPLFEAIQNRLKQERTAHLPSRFIDLDTDRKKLYDNRLELDLYLDMLQLELNLNWQDYPNLAAVREAFKLQNEINLKKVTRERRQLIDKLKRRLVREEMSELVKLSLEFRVGKVTSLEYHQRLLEMAAESHIQGETPHLKKMVRFLKKQKEFDFQQSVDELDRIHRMIKENFLKTEQQLRIQKEWEWLEQIDKMGRLEVSRDELDRFQRDKKEVFSFLKKAAQRENQSIVPLRRLLKEAELFYSVARKRDEALAQNTFKAIEENNKQIAVLITGGFHTDGLVDQLRGRDASYAVIAPRLTQQTDDALYASLMQPELSPLQRYLNRAGNRLATPSYLFAKTIIGNNPRIREKMQEADLPLIVLEYLGYRAFILKELGKDEVAITLALQQEMIGKKFPWKQQRYWDRFFREVAATELPLGLLISSEAEEVQDEDVALLIARGEVAFKQALETHRLGEAAVAIGPQRDLKKEASVARTLDQLRWIAKHRAKKEARERAREEARKEIARQREEARLAEREARRLARAEEKKAFEERLAALKQEKEGAEAAAAVIPEVKEVPAEEAPARKPVKVDFENLDVAAIQNRIPALEAKGRSLLYNEVQPGQLDEALDFIDAIDAEVIALGLPGKGEPEEDLQIFFDRAAEVREKVAAAQEDPMPRLPVLVGPQMSSFISLLLWLSVFPFLLGASGSYPVIGMVYYTAVTLAAFIGFLGIFFKHRSVSKKIIAESSRGQAAQEAQGLVAATMLLYKQAEANSRVLSAADFIRSYQLIKEKGNLNDPTQLTELLEIADPSFMIEVLTLYPWTEIETKYGKTPSDLFDAHQRFLEMLDQDEVPQGDLRQVQEYLKYVLFLYSLAHIKEKDVQEGERIAQEAIQKALQKNVLEESEAFEGTARFLIRNVTGSPEKEGIRLQAIAEIEAEMLRVVQEGLAQKTSSETLTQILHRLIADKAAQLKQQGFPIAYSFENKNQIERLQSQLNDFVPKLIERIKLSKETARQGLLSDPSVPHPFWGPEFPYIAEEPVFAVSYGQISSAQGKEKGFEFFILADPEDADSKVVIDVTQLEPGDPQTEALFENKLRIHVDANLVNTGMLEKEWTALVRLFLASKMEFTSRADAQVGDLVEKYVSGTGTEKKKVLGELNQLVQEDPYYKRVLSDKLTAVVWGRHLLGIYREIKETFIGIYRYGHDYSVWQGIGKLASMLILTSGVFALFAGAASMAVAQDADGGPVVGPPAGGPAWGGIERDVVRDPARILPPGRAPPAMDAALRAVMEERMRREQADRARRLRRGVLEMDEGLRHLQERLEVQTERDEGRERLNAAFARTQTEFFAVGVDLSEQRIPQEGREIRVPSDRFGNIVVSFSTRLEFLQYLFDHRDEIVIVDSEGNRITDILSVNQLILSGRSIEIWIGDPNLRNARNLFTGAPRAFKFEFGEKAFRDTAAAAREMVAEQRRLQSVMQELSRPGGAVVRFLRMDAGNRYENAPNLNIGGGRSVSSSFDSFRDLSILPPENFRFYHWPTEQNLRLAGTVLKGEPITSGFVLQDLDNRQIAYQTWYRDPNTGNEYLLWAGENAAQARLDEGAAYERDRLVHFNVRQMLSQGLPANLNEYPQPLRNLLGGVPSGLRTPIALLRAADEQSSLTLPRGPVFFETAELTMENGQASGLAQLHPFGDLQIETEEIPESEQIGHRNIYFDFSRGEFVRRNPLHRFKVNDHGFPLIRLTGRNDSGDRDGTLQVGFFVPQPGGRYLRLRSNEIDGFTGRFQIRVISNTSKAGTSSTEYLESDLGNLLIHGRNSLNRELLANRVGAFQTMIELMDAEKNLNGLYGELVVSTIATAFNVTLFVDPSGTGQYINRAIPLGIRTFYQLFIQSGWMSTPLPIINVNKGENETMPQAEARVREEALAVLQNLEEGRDDNVILDRLGTMFGVDMTSDDASRIYDFVLAAAAVIHNKTDVSTLTEDEKIRTVVLLFHSDWHLHREVTDRINFFTSLMVNAIMLSDTGNYRDFRLARDGSGDFVRDDNGWNRFVTRLNGNLHEGGFPASTVSFVNVASLDFGTVLREVSGSTGAVERFVVGGIGPSMGSIIKTLSFGNFYQDSPWFWEPEAIVVNLFGFPLQIGAKIRDTSNYIEGLKNYGVRVQIDSMTDWGTRFIQTFIGGRIEPISTHTQHINMQGSLRLIGYSRIPIFTEAADEEDREVVGHRTAPVYGVMSDGRITHVYIPGTKAFDDGLRQIQEDLAQYDRHHAMMGDRGGVIVQASTGPQQAFVPATVNPTTGTRFDLTELALLYRTTRNLDSTVTNRTMHGLMPSFLFQEAEMRPGDRNQVEVFDQALMGLFLSSMGDRQGFRELMNRLYYNRNAYTATPGGLENGLYVNTLRLNAAEGDAGRGFNPRANDTVHAGPNAFVGLAYLQRFSLSSSNVLNNYYRDFIYTDETRRQIRPGIMELLQDGDWENYQDYFAPDVDQMYDDMLSTHEEELQFTRQLATSIIAMQDDTEGAITEGGIWKDRANGIMSVEENLAAYAFLIRLHHFYEDDDYLEAAEKIMGFLSRSFDSNNNYFRVGTHKVNGRVVWNNTYAADVQALSVLAIGPEVLEYAKDDDGNFYFPGKWVASKILNELVRRTGVSVQVNGQLVWGLDGTDEAGRQAIRAAENDSSARPQAIFVESTGYAALAMQLNASFLENVMRQNSQERTSHRNNASLWASGWRNQASLLLSNLEKLAVRRANNEGGVGLPYATTTGIRRGPWDNWRVPHAAVSAAATASYGLARRSFNPYGLNGGSWYHNAAAQPSRYIFERYPQADRTRVTPPTSLSFTAGVSPVTIPVGRAHSLSNSASENHGERLSALLNAFIKVRNWDVVFNDAQRRDPANARYQPTDAERALIAGKTLREYDQTTNTFSYEENGITYRVTIIPSFQDIRRNRGQLEMRKQRAAQELQVIQRGAIRFLDPATRVPLDLRGNPVTATTGMPHLILGREPGATTTGANPMIDYLRALFQRDNLNPHQQHSVLMSGMVRTQVSFEQEDGSTAEKEVMLVIQHGLSGALENLAASDDTDARYQVVRALAQMRTQSGVIMTDMNGVLLPGNEGLQVGQDAVMRVLRWIQSLAETDPARMAQIVNPPQRDRYPYANFVMDRPDGSQVKVSLVFGDGMVERNRARLEARLERVREERRNLHIMASNAQRGAPFWHPEWAYILVDDRQDDQTGDMTLVLQNIYSGETIIKVERDGLLIRRDDLAENLRTFYHPETGETAPLYTIDTSGQTGRTLVVPVGLNLDGSLRYASVDHVTQTYSYNRQEGSVTTFNWLNGTVEKIERNDQRHVRVRIRGVFDRSAIPSGEQFDPARVNIRFNERTEYNFGTNEIEYEMDGQTHTFEAQIPSSGITYVNIDPQSGERGAAATVQTRSQTAHLTDDDWALLRSQGWTAIELIDAVTGARKIQIQDQNGRVREERSRERRTIFNYDPALQISVPVVVIDRAGRVDNSVTLTRVTLVERNRRGEIVRQETEEITYNHVMIQFTNVQRNADGDIVATGTDQSGISIAEIRDVNGHLKSRRVGNELTTYRYENGHEIPLETVNTADNSILVRYDFQFDAASHEVRVTAYDLRTGRATVEIRSAEHDYLIRTYSGRYETAMGPVTYESRTEIAYDDQGKEISRTTYDQVDASTGADGREFEVSTYAGERTGGLRRVRAENKISGTIVERVLNGQGHLVEERVLLRSQRDGQDVFTPLTALVYRYDVSQGVSLPVREIDLTGHRGGVDRTIDGQTVRVIADFLIETEGDQILITRIPAVSPGTESRVVEVRNRAMRLLEKRYANNHVIVFDQSLLERPLYQTAPPGIRLPGRGTPAPFVLQVIADADGRRLPQLNSTTVALGRDAENNAISGTALTVEDGNFVYTPAGNTQAPNVNVVYLTEYLPGGGTRVTEIETRREIHRGKPILITERDPLGRVTRIYQMRYSNFISDGDYPRVETLTTVYRYENQNNPFEITYSQTFSDNPAYGENGKVVRESVDPEFLNAHPELQERFEGISRSDNEGAQNLEERLSYDHQTRALRHLYYNPSTGLDTAVRESGNRFTVVHRNGHRVFRLRNTGESRFVGGRGFTRMTEDVINSFWPADHYSWFRINVGMTYSTSLPLKPAYDITPLDISNYDSVSFYIRGAEGGENYGITFTDAAGNLNNYTHLWRPSGDAANVTTGWRKVTIPLSEIVDEDGDRINQLIQVGVQYGQDMGNATGAQIYVSNFILESSNPQVPARPVLGVSGEISAVGDVELVPTSLTDGYRVADYTERDVVLSRGDLTQEDQGRLGRFSYLLNDQGAIIGTTDFIFEDDQGNRTYRIWRFEDGKHVNYDETVDSQGQLVDRVYTFIERVDNFQYSWRERFFYDSQGVPLFSVYEQNDPSLGHQAGQLRRLFQGRRDSDGNLRLWEWDMGKDSYRLFEHRTDGTSVELFYRDPDRSWEDFRATIEDKIQDVAKNWDSKYKRFEESVSPRGDFPLKTKLAYFFWVMSALIGLFSAFMGKRRAVQRGEDEFAAPARTVPELSISQVEAHLTDWTDLIKQIGFEDHVDDWEPFLRQDVLVRLRYTGKQNAAGAMTVGLNRLYKNNKLSEEIQESAKVDRVSLRRYIIYGVLRRHLWQFGTTQITEYLADEIEKFLDGDPNYQGWTPESLRLRLDAYRDVIYKMAHTHKDFKKKDTKPGAPSLTRLQLFMYEDVTALFRYFRETKINKETQERERKIDPAALNLDPAHILDLKDQLDANDNANHRYIVQEVQPLLAQADKEEGILPRAISDEGTSKRRTFSRMIAYLRDWVPPFNWFAYSWHKLRTFDSTLIPLKDLEPFKIGERELPVTWVIRSLAFVLGLSTLVAGSAVGGFPIWGAFLSGVAGYAGLILAYRLYQSDQLPVAQKGELDTSFWGTIFWTFTIGAWLFWNIFIGQVWLRGVVPYWDLMMQAGTYSTLSGAALLATSFFSSFFFLVLSFFSVAWFIGGLSSFGIMEKYKQARIKYDKPVRAWHVVLLGVGIVIAWAVLEILYYNTGFKLSYFTGSFLESFLWATLEKIVLTSAGLGGLSFLVWRLHKATDAGVLSQTQKLLVEKYRDDPVKMKQVTWQYKDLVEDMYASYKLTEKQREDLLKGVEGIGASLADLSEEDLEKLGTVLSDLKIKEARDRFKYWANNLLRDNPLEEVVPWNNLESLTLMIPTIDDFRRDWDALNWVDPTTGISRLDRILNSDYRLEFEIFLQRARDRGIDEGWATEEYIDVMEEYLAGGTGVSLPPFEGPAGKRFMREIEDWANDRLQMVETAFKGFVRVRKSYYEQALKKIALDRGVTDSDGNDPNAMAMDEMMLALLNDVDPSLDTTGMSAMEIYIQLKQTPIHKQAQRLVDEKFQILWSFGGPWVRRGFQHFKNPPKGKKANRNDPKFGKGWDLVYELWSTIEKELRDLGMDDAFIADVVQDWSAEGILQIVDGDVRTGPLYEENKTQGSAVELKLRRAWDTLIQRLKEEQGKSYEEIEEFKHFVTGSYMGYALVRHLNMAALHMDISTGAGSPKADSLAYSFAEVRGDTIMFFDGDTEIRLEDARKLLQTLKRFTDNPKLGVLQLAQYTFNEAYGRQNQLSVEAIGSFWHSLLRLKSKVGSVGFYGHNGIFRTQFLLDFDGMQPDHISEDILAYWILRAYGAEGGYEDRLQFGEGQETTQAMYAGPTAKWSSGASRNELQQSRSAELYFKSKKVSFAEKFDSLFNLAFYDMVHYYSVPAIIAFILGPFILGANPFAVLVGSYIFVGWGMSQAIGMFSLSQYVQREGIFKGTLNWLSFLFLRGGFFFWTAFIATQSEALRKGIAERAKWHTAQKDQAVQSETWESIFKMFNLGILAGVPLLAMFIYAPVSMWMLLAAAINLPVMLLWLYARYKKPTVTIKYKGRDVELNLTKITFQIFMGSLWVVPLLVGLPLFSAGGGSVIASLFYIYVLFSWVIGPFAFNPNPLRVDMDIYRAIAELENTDGDLKLDQVHREKHRKVGYALSRKMSKELRLRELFENAELVGLLKAYNSKPKTQNAAEKAALIDWLVDELDDKEAGVTAMEDFVDYLAEFEIFLRQYREEERFALQKVEKVLEERSLLGRPDPIWKKMLRHVGGFHFDENEELKPRFENKRGRAVFLIMKWTMVAVYELAILWATLLAVFSAVLVRVVPTNWQKVQGVLHYIVFVIQSARTGMRNKINYFFQYWIEEAWLDKEALYLDQYIRRLPGDSGAVEGEPVSEPDADSGAAAPGEEGEAEGEAGPDIDTSVEAPGAEGEGEAEAVASAEPESPSLGDELAAAWEAAESGEEEVASDTGEIEVAMADMDAALDDLDAIDFEEPVSGQVPVEEMEVAGYLGGDVAPSEEGEEVPVEEAPVEEAPAEEIPVDQAAEVEEEAPADQVPSTVSVMGAIEDMDAALDDLDLEEEEADEIEDEEIPPVKTFLSAMDDEDTEKTPSAKSFMDFEEEETGEKPDEESKPALLFGEEIEGPVGFMALAESPDSGEEEEVMAAMEDMDALLADEDLIEDAEVPAAGIPEKAEQLAEALETPDEDGFTPSEKEDITEAVKAAVYADLAEMGIKPEELSQEMDLDAEDLAEGFEPLTAEESAAIDDADLIMDLPEQAAADETGFEQAPLSALDLLKGLSEDLKQFKLKPNIDEDEESSSAFVLRRGYKLDRERLRAEAEAEAVTAQLVIASLDDLVLQTGEDQSEPYWFEMVNRSLALLVTRVNEEPELSRYFKEVLSREDNRAPPVNVAVSRELNGKTSAIRQVVRRDGKVEVRLLFSEEFVRSLHRLYPGNKEVVSWLIAERLFHELGHTNAGKSAEEALEEEIQNIRFDFKLNQLTRTLQTEAGEPLQDAVTQFITVNELGSLFPGFYFNFLAGLAAKDSEPASFETALRQFALSQLSAGEVAGVEATAVAALTEKEEAGEKAVQTSGQILQKLVRSAENGEDSAAAILAKAPVPAEAEESKTEAVRRLLADPSKKSAAVEVIEALVNSRVLTAQNYNEALSAAGETAEADENALLEQLQAAAQIRTEAAELDEAAVLEHAEELLEANRLKASPQLVVFDSSLLKRFKEDQKVIDLLNSYRSQIAVVVMRGDENETFVGKAKGLGFALTYENDIQNGQALEHAALSEVNAGLKKDHFKGATVVTHELSGSKWKWFAAFNYRVFVSGGKEGWSAWLKHAAETGVLEEALRKVGVSIRDVLKTSEPKAGQRELEVADNIVLISA